MFSPIRAIAVDDEPSHLLSITTGLSAIGIPCMGYWFDRDTSELRPSPPDAGHPFLRILFTDLNLAELGGVPDTSTLWATVVNVIKQLVSKDCGPYLLVFWSRVGAKAAEVKKMLYERADELNGIPCPIDILELSKAQFLGDTPKDNDFDEGLRQFFATLHANLTQLKQAVAGAVEADINLNAVSAWESRASEAAALAVNEVYRCARTDENDPSKISNSLKKVLAKIAIASSGANAAQTEPARALDLGMLDILVDQFGASVEIPQYKKTIETSISAAISGDIIFTNNTAMYAELNTFFHVDREVGTAKPSDRGAVIPVCPPIDRNILGFNPKDLLISEFLFPHELFPEELHPEIRQSLQDFKRTSQMVLIEVGADCDHAQGHDRTRRYLVGLEVPNKYLRLAKSHDDGKLRNGALEILGPWQINGDTIHLLISCRRFWTWQKRENPPGTVKYRLRASLVDKLLHRYSSWSSRPGIVEFR